MVEIATVLIQSQRKDFSLSMKKLNAMFPALETRTTCVEDSRLHPSMLEVNNL